MCQFREGVSVPGTDVSVSGTDVSVSETDVSLPGRSDVNVGARN